MRERRDSFKGDSTSPLKGEYEIVRKIGFGSFSKVYLVKRAESGQEFAAKIFDDFFIKKIKG